MPTTPPGIHLQAFLQELIRGSGVPQNELARRTGLTEKTLELASVHAEAAYRVAKAKAFLSAEGPVQARESQAVIATQRELIERGEAEALARTQVQLVKSLHARIDVGRTVASAERLLAGVVT